MYFFLNKYIYIYIYKRNTLNQIKTNKQVFANLWLMLLNKNNLLKKIIYNKSDIY